MRDKNAEKRGVGDKLPGIYSVYTCTRCFMLTLTYIMAAATVKCDPDKASDSCPENLNTCQPCYFEGIVKLADRFCLECQEYLCPKCSSYHKALMITRKHSLVTTKEATKTSSVAAKDKCSLKCTKHASKTVNYFCVAHAYLGCSVCITMEHRQCHAIEYIPEVAETLRNKEDFIEFERNMKALSTAYKTDQSDVRIGRIHIRSDEIQLKKAIQTFRKEVNDALDELDNALTLEAIEISMQETRKLDGLSEKFAKSIKYIDSVMKEMGELLSSDRNCDAFVLMKQSNKLLVSLNDGVIDTTAGKTYQRYEFRPACNSPYMMRHALKPNRFGQLIKRSEDISRRSAVAELVPWIEGRSQYLSPGSRFYGVTALRW